MGIIFVCDRCKKRMSEDKAKNVLLENEQSNLICPDCFYDLKMWLSTYPDSVLNLFFKKFSK
jgi:hypothetical protein